MAVLLGIMLRRRPQSSVVLAMRERRLSRDPPAARTVTRERALWQAVRTAARAHRVFLWPKRAKKPARRVRQARHLQRRDQNNVRVAFPAKRRGVLARASVCFVHVENSQKIVPRLSAKTALAISIPPLAALRATNATETTTTHSVASACVALPRAAVAPPTAPRRSRT